MSVELQQVAGTLQSLVSCADSNAFQESVFLPAGANMNMHQTKMLSERYKKHTILHHSNEFVTKYVWNVKE